MKTLLTVLLSGIAILSNAQNKERIVTAGSAITETVCALGECESIVGSDRTSLYPEKIQQLPSIGYRSGINAEGILSLKPTLIIAEKDYVEDAVLQQLKAASIKLLIIDRNLSVDDTRQMITQIGATLNRNKEAQSVIAKLDSDLKTAQSLLARKTGTPKVLCIFNRGTSTISAGGAGTFAEILKYAGADNAVANLNGYKPLNTESLIEANPDYILLVSSGFQSLGGLDGVLKLPGVALTTAGKQKQIISMESLKLTNFGPRVGEAIKELITMIHPNLAAAK